MRNLIFWSLIAWGTLASVQGMLHDAVSLIVVRFLIGVVEAAVLPAMVIFLSHWFTKRERGRANTFPHADPPMIMRDTVQAIVPRLDDDQRAAVTASVEAQAERVATYVRGYRLKQKVQFLDEGPELDTLVPEDRRLLEYTRVQVFLEIEGAAMYLPAYAGNLDIMTSAAMRTAERMVLARKEPLQ